VGVGMSAVVVPQYTAELAATSRRGQLTAVFELVIPSYGPFSHAQACDIRCWVLSCRARRNKKRGLDVQKQSRRCAPRLWNIPPQKRLRHWSSVPW
jgi:hypothetical protein